jgi:hypothetical protein
MNFLTWARGQWDRVLGWVLIAAGGLALVLGWSAVADEALTSKQIPLLLSGGLGGLFLLGLGGMLCVSADLRDEWRVLSSIDETLQADAEERRAAAAPKRSRRAAS